MPVIFLNSPMNVIVTVNSDMAGPESSSKEQLRADREDRAALLLLCPRPPSSGQTRHQVCRLYLGKYLNCIIHKGILRNLSCEMR